MQSAKHRQNECDLNNCEDIVISGISGRFPESDNIDELNDNLFNHVDMVTEDDRRYPIDFFGLPSRMGKLKDLNKFDAHFFGVHGKQADYMDPQARMLLELTYEAIVDAGINPQVLRGTRTGVYIGSSSSEVEEVLMADLSRANGYALTGCSRSMFSNRISYTFDFRGPSYTMDTACSSSLLALQQAFLAIKANECDQAIVGGSNICVRPATSVQFNKLNMLSPDGKCKHLDESANGYVRSETCAVIFLQRKKNAKRIYATVVHAKTNTDGHKPEGITYPSWISQMNIMKETIAEAGIDPIEVNYIEAHGTGTPVGDPVETKAIAKVFCQGRMEPLLVGSIKTNLGHAEPASGMNSIAKVLLIFKNKQIPANLHFKSSNLNIAELQNGLIKPVIKNTSYQDGIIAINSFGFGGVNVHVLLKPHRKETNLNSEYIIGNIPRIILATGRTELSVNYILEFIEKNFQKINGEFLALLQDISQINENSGMNNRGYMLVDKSPNGLVVNSKEIVQTPRKKRPVWFIYSGMGSQWTSMAKDLISIDLFKESLEISAKILNQFNIDLLNLVLSENETLMQTTIAPFVSIAAIQIALTDLMKKLSIKPDGIVGHSVGELGCAYADNTFTKEQILLAAYWRGKCIENAKLPKGLMAAVGLSWEESKNRCPAYVVPACHNSPDSVTISGNYEETKKFIEQLRNENIFVREVNSCGVAFHSYLMESIAPSLLKKLKQIIPNPNLRSSKWISSSCSENSWQEELAKYSSAEYFVNNLTSPVLFYEALQHIPKNAIIIEIAPHSLLQAVIKRTLGSDISYISLMQRNNNENLSTFLNSIGKLYNYGLNPDIKILYPKIEYPVSRNVQSLSSLIRWDHSHNWLLPLYPDYFNPNQLSNYYTIKIDLQEKTDQFYAGHCIDGRILFPATGYLFLAWQMLCKIKGQLYEKTSVEFENVILHRAIMLNNDNPVKFETCFTEATGEFTITENGTIVATGRIFMPEKNALKIQNLLTDKSIINEDNFTLYSKDVYKELRLRGYDYGPAFQGIVEASSDSRIGKLKYLNWVVLADSMLQFGILGKSTNGLYLPVRFQSVRCDPTVLFKSIKEAEGSILKVINDPRINCIVVAGLEFQGLKANLVPRRAGNQIANLEKYLFTPYYQDNVIDEKTRLKIDEYISVTTILANRVIELFKISSLEKFRINNINKSLLKSYINSNDDQYVVLLMLKNFLDNLNEKNDILNKYCRKISHDLLATIHEWQSHIGILIDIVIENMATSKMNIVEINLTDRFLVNIVKELINLSNNFITIKYTLLSSSTNIQLEDINQIIWNIEDSQLPLKIDSTDLIIYKDSKLFQINSELIDYRMMIESAFKSLKSNGFFIAIFRSKPTPAEIVLFNLYNIKIIDVYQRVDKFKNLAKNIGFHLVASRNDNRINLLFLFRKTDNLDKNKQSVVNITHTDYDQWVNLLKIKMFEHQQKPIGENIWLLAKDNPANGIVGLVKCLRKEPGGERVRCIFNTNLNCNHAFPEFSFENSIFNDILKKDLVMNVYRDQQFGSFRHFNIDSENLVQTQHAYLNVATRGDLSSLKWYEAQHKYWPILPKKIQQSCGTLFHVYYSPLNFRDIMLATGKLPPDALPGNLAIQDCILGLEFSGRNDNGDRVMGMVPGQGLATTVLVQDLDFLWPIPNYWSMEEASTVPVAYSTAYYALIVRGELKHGETVLIHSGSGGVGQAAISICLTMNCTVYTTVGTDEKRTFLKKMFPQLMDKNISNSRDTSFEQHVLRETNGHGVDIVLNSLSEEKLQASVRCLAQHGRFLEIGKYDLSQNNPLGMAAFLKNITFHGILLDALMNNFINKSPLVVIHKKMVSKLIRNGIKTGAVRPLKCNVFDLKHTEDAFRFMATGKHIGKVVLQIRPEESSRKKIMPSDLLILAIPRTVFIQTKSYIITGGLGGFGLELAKWLAERGARNIVLNSRHGPKKPYQHLCLNKLLESGVKCIVSTDDITSIHGAKQLLDYSSSIAPVGGIFHLAMVLNDAFLENQTAKSFELVCAAKIHGTENLDQLSRQYCPNLDYFVAFSSVSCGRGNSGQTNYGFANSSMERICELRRAAGLHGLAIQWGSIGDVGVVLENFGVNEVIIGGTIPQRMPSCLAVLDRFLQTNEPVCCSLVRAKPKSTELVKNKQCLIKTIAHILGIKNIENFSPSNTLSELGMDSLMGVEVKQFLERDYELVFSLQELRAMTIGNLMELNGIEWN